MQKEPNGRQGAARGANRGRFVQRLQAFAAGKYGLPVLGTAAVLVCILLGFGLFTLLAGGRKEAASSSEAAADSRYDAAASAIDTSEYADTILPETKDAGEEYVENTLFIGDSNTARYILNGQITLENGIGVVGMGAGQIDSLKCVKFKGKSGMVTIPAAVAIMQPQRVVFSFGTNNLTGDVDTFIEEYQAGIQAAYEEYPYFDVIVNAIPPVAKSRSYPNITMQDVDKFNAALVKMCQENGWKFLNSSEALKDETTGFAKSGYTVSDGIHLSEAGCEALFDYVRTHAYETEDKRPKPLAEIPTHQETPTDLIVKDPLQAAGTTAGSVAVSFVAGTGGSISGTTEQSVAPGGVCAGVTAVPAEGYAFAGWSCTIGSIADPASPSLRFTVPAGDGTFGGIVVTASFTPVAATAAPTATPEVTATPTPAATATPEVTATPAPTATPEVTAAPPAATEAPAATPETPASQTQAQPAPETNTAAETVPAA